MTPFAGIETLGGSWRWQHDVRQGEAKTSVPP